MNYNNNNQQQQGPPPYGYPGMGGPGMGSPNQTNMVPPPMAFQGAFRNNNTIENDAFINNGEQSFSEIKIRHGKFLLRS
jgi:hypothetical protein